MDEAPPGGREDQPQDELTDQPQDERLDRPQDEGPDRPRDERRDRPADHPPESRPSPPPRLLLFPDDPDAGSGGLGGRTPIYVVSALVLVAVAIWFVRSGSPDLPGARPDLDSFRAPPTTTGAWRGIASAPELPPSEIEGGVGSTVELVISPRDDRGDVLPDTLLRLSVESGTGSLGIDTVRTDSSGTARALVTLAPRPEIMVVAAEVTGAELPPVRVTVVGRAGPPRRIVKVAGDAQVTDAVGLLEGLAIRVTDGAGNPVEGVQIQFTPDADNGLVAPSRPRTDSLGLASTRWRLGPEVGEQRLRAEVPGAEISSVVFTATALGDPAVAATADTALADSVPDPELEPEVEPDPVVVVRRTFGVGGTFVCGIASGRPACRGANDRGQLGRGGDGGLVGLALGVAHACGLDASGDARCWGANDGGQLGDGSRTDRAAPVPVATDLAFSTLAAGAGHTCGLASGGRVACWGRNLSGQLGDGTREDRSVPTLLPSERAFRSLVAGWEHTCGLSAAGELACWGSNGQGQLGDGSRTDRLAPTPLSGSFNSVVAGSRHTCGIRGGQVLCWGDNGSGQLGDGSTQLRTEPKAVSGLPAAATRLVAGAVHTCALLEDGSAWCWGQNIHGQLGDGTTQNRATPNAVAGELTFRSLFAGGALTCGFTTDGAQYCWGLNQTGQLGDGTRVNRASPVRIGG